MKLQGLWSAQEPRPVVVFAIAVVIVAAAGSWPSTDGRWLLLVAAPLVEEVVFRWGLQDGLESVGASSGVAMAGSAAAFALLHGLTRSTLLGVVVLLPALAFAALYRRTRRLAPGVAAHAAANAAWLAMTSTGPIRAVWA